MHCPQRQVNQEVESSCRTNHHGHLMGGMNSDNIIRRKKGKGLVVIGVVMLFQWDQTRFFS